MFTSLVPRPLTGFQRSREKREGLVCHGTWPYQPQGQVIWKLSLVAFCLVYWSRNNVESYLQRSKTRICDKITPGKPRNKSHYHAQLSWFQVKGHSCAVAYQALQLFSWMLKSWEWPGDEAKCLPSSTVKSTCAPSYSLILNLTTMSWKSRRFIFHNNPIT